MQSAYLERIVSVPAPVLFALSFTIGFVLDRALHLQVHWMHLLRPVGWLLFAAGIFIGPGSALLFAVRRTTLNPAGQPSRFVTNGAFRFTRNPMYLGLAVAYCGLAVVLGLVCPILLLPLPVLLLNFVVIPFEEKRLSEAFGDDFSDYCLHVRRWL